MVIEESILINASLDEVWITFTNLACWANWNSAMKNVASEHDTIQKGGTFRCSLRPFIFSVSLEPYTEELIPNERVVWTGRKFGIFARHEFIFKGEREHVRVTSREIFQGITIENMKFIFPGWRIRELTRALLRDLKQASEKRTSSPGLRESLNSLPKG